MDPFKPEEAARIRAYVDRGKPVLLLLGNEHPSGLEEFLKSHNLEIGKGLVIDPNGPNYNGNWQLVVASPRSGVDHPISAAMAADRCVLLPQRGADPRSPARRGGPARRRPTRWTRAWSPSAILQTEPDLLGGDRPEEPAADPGSLGRRDRAR